MYEQQQNKTMINRTQDCNSANYYGTNRWNDCLLSSPSPDTLNVWRAPQPWALSGAHLYFYVKSPNQSWVTDVSSDRTMLAQIPPPPPPLSPLYTNPPLSYWRERRIVGCGGGGGEGVNGIQRRGCAVGVNNKVNSFCRSVQVQSLLTKLQSCGSATLEFHYTAVRACVQGGKVSGSLFFGVDVGTTSFFKELQVGFWLPGAEQDDTVNVLRGQQGHSKARGGTNEAGQKHVFGDCLVALEALGGITQHKGLIHGLRSTTARIFGRSLSGNIPLSNQVCDEYKVKWKSVSSIVSPLMLLIL